MSVPAAAKPDKVEKFFDLAKTYLLTGGNYRFPIALISAGMLLLGDQPLLLHFAYWFSTYIGLKLPELTSAPWPFQLLSFLFLSLGFVIGAWHFFAPAIRPVKHLILQYSYQPIGSAGPRSVIKGQESCWVAPIHLDLLGIDFRSEAGVREAVDRTHWMIRRLRKHRNLYLASTAHIPLVGYLGFLLRNFSMQFFEINHVTKKPVLLDGANASGLNFTSTSTGTPTDQLALIIEVSYPVDHSLVDKALGPGIPFARLSIANTGLSKIESEVDLNNLTLQVRNQIGTTVSTYRQVKTIHLFYAGPTSLIFRIGQILNENTDPEVLAYNYSRDLGGYIWALSLNKGARIVQLP